MQPNDASVADYIAARAKQQQGADCAELIALMEKLTGQPPVMWGPSIVGHGQCRYTLASGRSDLMPLAGFAIRGRELVVYLEADSERQQRLLAVLGKHRMCKSCLYFKRLDDIDRGVLAQMIANSVADARQRYGQP